MARGFETMSNYPFYQRDPAIAGNKLGASNLTIGRAGCTTCAVCDGLHFFGFKITPEFLAADPNLYTKPGDPQGEGLILWQELNKLLPGGFKMIKRNTSRVDADIIASLKDPNQFVILKVNNGAHWTLALRTLPKNDYLVDDPWTGKKVSALSIYHNIVGSVHFGR